MDRDGDGKGFMSDNGRLQIMDSPSESKKERNDETGQPRVQAETNPGEDSESKEGKQRYNHNDGYKHRHKSQ